MVETTQMSERQERAFRLNAVACVLALWGGAAVGAEINLGNPDLKLRWDNTIRYNLGMRMEGQDPRILASPTYDEGDAKFNKHRIVTNRLDLLSEFDANYRGKFGGRISAAAWYDHAYRDHSVTSPAGGVTSYYNNEYNNQVSRFANGPSGEILDAFGWANFNLGDVPVNLKIGRHSIVWGEGLLIGAHAISYSQAPLDGYKAVASPGIETKELFLPLNQVSFKAQVTPALTVAGQYFFEWRETRAPNGGTYLAGADTSPYVDRLSIVNVGSPIAAAGYAATNVDAYKPRQRGNWGLSARLNVEAINSTVGLYYREFNDYNPENGIQFRSFTQLVPGNAATTVPSTFRFVYPQGTKLIGLSLARPIGPVSVGAEVSYRKNAALNTVGSYASTNLDTGARGDTVHAVLNGVYLLPKTPLWETGSLAAEFAYSYLAKVTENEQLYKGVGNLTPLSAAGALACSKVGAVATTPGDKSDGCSTRHFLQMAVNFAPQYLGILPSWDLTLPVSVNYGIRGVAPSGSGGFEKLLVWSVGANMTYQAKHEFSLRYADLRAPSTYNTVGTTLIGGGASGGSIGSTDRGWLVFTYRTAF